VRILTQCNGAFQRIPKELSKEFSCLCVSILNFLGNFCVLPVVTEVTIIPFCSTFRIQNAINPHSPVFTLVLLHAISTPIQGAINAVVFGLDKETTSKLTPTQIKVKKLFLSIFILFRRLELVLMKMNGDSINIDP
jgi:hypothetical protein